MTRYLTDDEKTAEVARWLAYRSSPEAQPPESISEPGGMGYPDPDIFALTDALNQIDGVLTIQSCAGHLHPGQEADEHAMWSGKLWLRLVEPLMALFTERVYELLEQPTIETCERIFLRGVGDIAEVYFQGNDRGKLAESSAVILSFFKGLSA